MTLWENQIVYDNTNSAYWDTQSFAPDTDKVALPPESIEGSMFTLVFTRAVEVGLTEDVAVTSFHLAVDAGPGAPMVPLSASQAALIEANWDGAWSGAAKTLVQVRWVLKEFQWRNFGAAYPQTVPGPPNFNPATSKPGPIWRITPYNQAGTSGGQPLADQLSATVTYRTASRRHWGRNYWVGLTSGAFATETMGKLANSYVDTLAAIFRDFLTANKGESAIVNTWVWSARHRGALSINEVSVDDVPDVIRRRRAKHASYRKTYSS